MNTKDFWSGDFGDAYLKRNRVDWRARIPFWKAIIDVTGARSVFELGCNSGWNLSAIRRAYPDVERYGFDINRRAAYQSKMAGHQNIGDNHIHGSPVEILSCYSGGLFDLAFTAGVLIHVAPDELESTMVALVDTSSDYVLAVEYAAEQEEEVLYRGHEGKLWKRPYGKLYQGMGLTLVQEFDAGVGFDNCTAWLLRK